MLENMEQNLNISNDDVLANSYSNLQDNFFYDTKDDEFIDTNDLDNSDSFSESEIENVGLPMDVVEALQSRVEDSINNDTDENNTEDGEDGGISLQDTFVFSTPETDNLPFEEKSLDISSSIEENKQDTEAIKVDDTLESGSQTLETDEQDEVELPSLNVDSNKDATTNLDDSYVLSNFDVLFDSLYSDVTGANNFISNLIEQKRTVNVNEANLAELTSKFEREKEEFNKYVETQKQAIETEKQQCNDYIKTQKLRLQNEEAQFNSDCESTRAELNLAEQTLKVANEKLNDEREQFEKNKILEEEKLKSDRQKLELEREQFEKEKAISLEKIKNAQKELQLQKEQFAKSKELEEKKLELESKNLSQSCARFKELVTQFNSGFQQLPDNKE